MSEYFIADLPNKQANPKKQSGRAFFFSFVTYIKEQVGTNCHLLHETLQAGWILFSKMVSELAFLLGRSEYSSPPLHTPHCLCFKLFKRKNISRSTTTPLARLLLSCSLSSIYSWSIKLLF